MDNSATGLNVVISVDTTQMVSGLNTAKQQLSQFSSTASSTMQGLSSSTQAASEAFDNVSNSSNAMGAAVKTASGNTREMRESVEALRLGLTGAGDATSLVAAGLSKFAGALGGPMLLGATLAIAALGLLVQAILKVVDGQKQLQLTATALNMPVDKIDNYTKSMITLQQKLADVALGFSNLNDAQKNFGAATGIDMTSNPTVTSVMKPIVNSTSTETQKAQAVATAFNMSMEDATKALKDFEDAMARPVGDNGFWSGLGTGTVNAFASLTRNTGLQTQGEAAGIIPGSSGKPLSSGATTPQNAVDTAQQQLTELQSVQDKIADITKEGNQAQNDAISDPAQKILAEADQKIKDLQTALTNLKQQIANDKNLNPTQKSSLSAQADSSTNTAISATRAAAAARAQQAEQQAMDELQPIDTNKIQSDQYSFAAEQAKQLQDAQQAAQDQAASVNNMATNLSDAGTKALASAQLKSDTTEAQQILDQAQDKIKELDQKLAEDIQKVNDTKDADPATKTKEIGQLQSAHDTSVAQINQASKTLIQQSSPVTQMFKQWSDSSQQFQQTFVQGMQGMADSLTQFIMTGKMNFDQFADQIIADLIRIALEKEIAGMFGGLFGSAGGGTSQAAENSSVASSFLSGHAGGGTVQAGVPTMVGERGPEMFVPNTSGNIINAANVGSGGGGNFNVSVVNQSSTQVKAKNAKPTQSGKDMMIQIFLDDLNRGGPMSSGLTQAYGLQRSTLS